MKKRFLGAVLSLSLLASCAAPAAETLPPTPAKASASTSTPAPEETPAPVPTPPAGEMPTGTEWADYYARVILYSQSDGADYSPLSAEDGAFYLTEVYGVPLPEREDKGFGYAVYTAGDVDAREVAVVCGLDSTAAAGMEAHRQSRVADFTGYVPDQAELAEKGVVLDGNMAVLLICTDPDAAQKALKEAASTLVLEPYDPAETGEPYDWTDYVNDNGWHIFDPPNEYDMTPYDTTAVLTAWETGEESGLGDRELLILTGAKAALEECGISDGMSDYEKELALHDWLVEHVSYDRTVHDPGTPEGREGNLEPYGPLVNGYGICLGYAATFRLLMDMAGVECITVVGASNESRQDHAWNMVKLAGEWYCVDVTWDDPTLDAPGAYTQEALNELHHKYFNVTSQYMRDTNHQWDYQNVPEAAATRFRWAGTGELPE